MSQKRKWLNLGIQEHLQGNLLLGSALCLGSWVTFMTKQDKSLEFDYISVLLIYVETITLDHTHADGCNIKICWLYILIWLDINFRIRGTIAMLI